MKAGTETLIGDGGTQWVEGWGGNTIEGFGGLRCAKLA